MSTYTISEHFKNLAYFCSPMIHHTGPQQTVRVWVIRLGITAPNRGPMSALSDSIFVHILH